MATVQQSIDLTVPVRTVDNQLTQCEDSPQCMDEMQDVKQLDDTHLHSTTTMSTRPVERDAEIAEQESGRSRPRTGIAGGAVSGVSSATASPGASP